MARKSEREFVGEGMSDEDFAALNGDVSEPVTTVDEPPQTTQDAPAPVQASESPPSTEPPQTGQNEQKMVDVRALQEARAEIRKRDEEIRRQQEEFARADERIKMLQAAWETQQKKPEGPKAPDPNEEPIEYFNHKIQTLEEQLAAREKAEAERAEQMRMAEERQAVISQADVVLSRAVEAEPELVEAFQFAFKAVQDNIADWVDQTYPHASDAQKVAIFQQTFDNERLKYARMCPRDPVKAADFVRRNAWYHGWKQGLAQAEQPPAQLQAPQVPQPTLQQRQEQQQRHMSLSGVSGAEPPRPLDAKSIAAMSEKEWKEFMKTPAGKKAAEEHFGGY